METEAEFLYNVSDRDRLFACITNIMNDLNESGECALSIEGYIGFPIYLQVDRHEDLMSRILAGDQNLLLSSETIVRSSDPLAPVVVLWCCLLRCLLRRFCAYRLCRSIRSR